MKFCCVEGRKMGANNLFNESILVDIVLKSVDNHQLAG